MATVNKQAVAAAFGRAASGYTQHDELQRRCADLLLRQLARRDFAQVLDAGCGPGSMSRYWREAGSVVTALDLSAGMLAQAQRNDAAQHYLLGDIEALPLPDGAEYLYALGSDNEDGFWLLSGSLPGAYADGHGAVHFSESTTIGKLALTHYGSAGAMQETILLQTIYAENGARFSQLRTTEHGFLLLSSSLLVLLDKAGAETARQTAETDDGWAYEAMTVSGGTLCVLTRDRYGATPLPELRRFAPETLAPTDTLPCETNLTGLGLAADGRLLCGSSKSIDGADRRGSPRQLAGAGPEEHGLPALPVRIWFPPLLAGRHGAGHPAPRARPGA